MKLYSGKIPFDKKGNLVTWARPTDPSLRWADNSPFYAEMEIYDYLRGRSAARFRCKDESGRQYDLFTSSMMDVIKNGIEPGGKVKGWWAFAKRGADYGLIPIPFDDSVLKLLILKLAEFGKAEDES